MPPTAYRALGKIREKVGSAGHGCPEPDDRATLRGQLYLRIPSGVGNGKELNHYEENRHPSPMEEAEMDA